MKEQMTAKNIADLVQLDDQRVEAGNCSDGYCTIPDAAVARAISQQPDEQPRDRVIELDPLQPSHATPSGTTGPN